MPLVCRATKLKPSVEPTMLCVPDIGSFKNVATKSQKALLAKAETKPNINSVSEPLYNSTSKIPLRIVSDTLYPGREKHFACQYEYNHF